MTPTDDPTPADQRRATRAMLAWLIGKPEDVEIEIIDAHESGRIDAFILALMTIASAAPGARDPSDPRQANAEWVQRLRDVVVTLGNADL